MKMGAVGGMRSNEDVQASGVGGWEGERSCWPGLHGAIVPTPDPGLIAFLGGDPGLKPGLGPPLQGST